MDLDKLKSIRESIFSTNLLHKTPMLSNVGSIFEFPSNIDLYFKLENMQNTGSFKIRGVINQMQQKIKGSNENNSTDAKYVTFSGGNYGRSFSYVCSLWKLKGKVLLPDTADPSRVKYIQECGLEAEQMPTSKLLGAIEDHGKNGWQCFHPFDDMDIIGSYASIAFEILETVDPDIVLIGCGGGGLLSGISLGLSLLGSKATVYGVEPETANAMYQSFEKGEAVRLPTAKSIATGLAPPIAGTLTYNYCKEYTKGGILLVSDDEIKSAWRKLFDKGIKIELSGAASFAALLHNKVPNLLNSNNEPKKVVVLFSGGNISAEEVIKLLS